MWQKCPICNGTGDDPKYITKKCEVCTGKGIINQLTGLPPQQLQKNKSKDIDFSKVIENDLEK
jgi:DnaJ-class molecular chaperone